MYDTTINEIRIILKIFKNFSNKYNSNNLAKEIGLSAMGALKILRKLYEQNLLKIEEIGKAKIYSINFKNEYVKQYISFLLRKEAEESKGKIKRWIVELRKLDKSADIGLLFGSVLKSDKYNDVDMLAVLKQSQLKEFNKKVEELNKINVKRIHLIKQSIQDLKDNLIKKDKVILNAVKQGIVLFGYEKFVEVVESVSL
ncbi:MAG: hypothetical protein KAT77_01290 [Nanoarchaeota archaeon]|nr:hypothetical protein [Nanoarchaeota archaeon]